MLSSHLSGYFLSLLSMADRVVPRQNKAARPFHCTGGSIYFAAHPVDVLLYQNPDIFHDLYVFKCTTTVIFTSGDRGIEGNYSHSLERGLEDAYSYMAGEPLNETLWKSREIQLENVMIFIRSLKAMPHVQVVYLRLPSSTPDGQAYNTKNEGSLKRLYTNQVKKCTATDGSTVYTLKSLKNLISTILEKRKPNDIRLLDFGTSVPEDNGYAVDHADHAVSARIVAEVVECDKIKANVRGYAGAHVKNLLPTFKVNSTDFQVKSEAYFYYAKYDKHMCQTYTSCSLDAEQAAKKNSPTNDDTQWVAPLLEREYYLQS